MGRERELALLSDAVGTGDGRVGAVAVGGDPGIGKTTLLDRLAGHCRGRGGHVCVGRAAERDRQVPFGLLRAALDDPAIHAARRRLGTAEQILLDAVLPVVGAMAGTTAEIERYRLHQALRTLLSATAGTHPGGLLVCLDDVHWADEGTVAAVDYLLRHRSAAGFVLAIGLRPRQCPPGLAAVLAEASRHGRAVTVELKGLEAPAAEVLFEHWGTDPGHRTALYTASNGNPLYLETLARHGDAPPAATPADGTWAALHHRFIGEFSALRDDEALVAAAAAVAGDPFDPGLVAAIAPLDADRTGAALTGLARRDLIRADGAGLRYRHPLLVGAAHATADPVWRLGAHQRAYEALRARGAAPTTLAGHVVRYAVQGDARAVDALVVAARSAMATAPATAAHWFDAAAGLLPHDPAAAPQRLDLLAHRAYALAVSGQLAEGRQVTEAALALVPAGAPTRRADLVRLAAMLDSLLGHHAEALGLLNRELSTLADRHSALAVQLQLEYANARLNSGQFIPPDTETLRTARDLGDPAMLALAAAQSATLALCAGVTGARVRELATEAAEIIDALSDTDLHRQVNATTWLGLAEMFLERWPAALRHLERGLRLARASGQQHLTPYLLLTKGVVLAFSGRLAAADEVLHDAAEAAALTGSAELRTQAGAQRAWVAVWRGDLPAARGYASEAISVAGDERDWNRAFAHAALALVALFEGDPERCAALIADLDLTRIDAPTRPTWLYVRTRALALLGDTAGAAACADQCRQTVSGLDLPMRRGIGLLAEALVAPTPEAALAAAEQAADLLDAAAAPVFAGQAYLAIAATAGSTGDDTTARAAFARARELFDGAGAERFYAEAVRAQRRMNASRPRAPRTSDVPAGLEALTPREREIADAVSEGLTNREIATRAFLSVKTVERHLHRIFAKLDLSGRAALAAIVASTER
ncbi:ATP-binding protein [Pilimelia anulata]|uniref:ATP-binding protein n=1 Tax=Pilimelia anulata TaxID=53371 RepID=UPI00166B0DC2|nr:LuxR family transcriptional regulator [Pilimelia anulata]